MSTHGVTPMSEAELKAFYEFVREYGRCATHEESLRLVATVFHHAAEASNWGASCQEAMNQRDEARKQLASKEPVIEDLIARAVLAEKDARRCRQVLEKWAEYRFCCSDTPSEAKLDKMLYDAEEATMDVLGYKVK